MNRILSAIVALIALTGTASAQFVTPHDTIPDFGSDPTIRSTADGLASDSATWDCGCVPGPDDVVAINHTVAVDHIDAKVISVAGTLNILQGAYLRFKDLQVVPGGKVLGGSPDAPIEADIVVRDLAPDDGLQFGTGITVINGTFKLYGEPKTPFERLAIEPIAGDQYLSLENPPVGWQAGDRLVIPDTRETRSGASQHETLFIGAPVTTGVLLALPITNDHFGARDTTGALRFLPHVANLSRSIVIRSENPNGWRGHVLLTGHSDVDIRNVEFRSLGRTTAAPLVAPNQIGRYPLHLHHVYGLATPQPNGHQFTVTGNVAEDCRKWCIALHDSHYGLAQGDVAYNAQGAGIVTEDGSETGNVIDGNMVAYVVGSGAPPNGAGRPTSDQVDNGHEGSCFWFRAQRNRITNNVATDCAWAGIMVYSRAGHVGKLLPRNFPKYQGANTHTPGQFLSMDARQSIASDWGNNEAYASNRGMEFWYAFAGLTHDDVAWRIAQKGNHLTYHGNAILDRLTLIGDQNVGEGITSDHGIGLIVRDAEIQRQALGFRAVPSGNGVFIDNPIFAGNTVDIQAGQVYNEPQPFTIALVSPVAEGTASGTISIQVTADTTVPTIRARMHISGRKVLDDYAAPFQSSFNTATLPNGPHWVVLEVWDNAGVAGSTFLVARIFVQN